MSPAIDPTLLHLGSSMNLNPNWEVGIGSSGSDMSVSLHFKSNLDPMADSICRVRAFYEELGT